MVDEQQWAETYIQHNPVAPNGYSAVAEIHPHMLPDQRSPYEGMPVKIYMHSKKLKHSFQQNRCKMSFFMLLQHSTPPTSHRSTCAAKYLRPGDLHPLQEKRNAQDHRDGSPFTAPLPPRGSRAQSRPTYLLPLHRWFAGPQTGTICWDFFCFLFFLNLTDLAMQLGNTDV